MLLVALGTQSTRVNAQQDPMYSQYMFNMLAVNPAYAGTREMVSMTAMYRKQWVGIEGAPTTLTLGIDAPIKNQRMALGLNVINDKIGISSDMTINAVYAYRVMFSNYGVLSLGLQAGVNQYQADYSSVKTSTYYGGSADDPAFANAMNSLFPNAGFGAYYYTNRFFASIGVPRLIKNNLSGENNPTVDFTSFPNRQNRHMFVSSGYTFDLDQDWQLKPSVMIKGVKGAPVEADVNIGAWWKQTLGFAISYRSADAIVAMLEIKPKKEIHLGYAYDYTVSGLRGTNSGSHEIMLRYEPQASKLKPRRGPAFKSAMRGPAKKNFKNLKQRKRKSAAGRKRFKR